MTVFIVRSVERGTCREVGGRERSGIVQRVELLNTVRVSLLTLSVWRIERETGLSFCTQLFHMMVHHWCPPTKSTPHEVNFNQIN